MTCMIWTAKSDIPIWCGTERVGTGDLTEKESRGRKQHLCVSVCVCMSVCVGVVG